MCNCVDIEFGDYSNMVVVDPPPHMAHHRGPLNIDPCIYSEIRSLWEYGVETFASCCGHNRVPPSIIVAEASVPKMLELGYEVHPVRELACCPELNFLPKTVEWRKE